VRFKKHSKTTEYPGVMRPSIPSVQEGLTGIVKGKKASDIEERFAIALDRFGIGYSFQRYVPTEYTLPDQEKQVDFIVFYRERAYPVEIYGLYWHDGADEIRRDQERERQLNDVFESWGWEKLQIVWERELFDQQAAYAKVSWMFT